MKPGDGENLLTVFTLAEASKTLQEAPREAPGKNGEHKGVNGGACQ